MTATTPENGFRARLRRVASGTAVFAIALGACAVAVPSAASAADAADPASVELAVTIGANGTVTQGAGASASVSVHNDAESELSGGHVVIELNRTPLPDAAAVTSWLDDEKGVESGFTPLASDATAAVDAGATATASVPIAPEALADLTPGVYPLRAELSGATTGTGDDAESAHATATSVLVVAAGPRPQVTVLVPITATPEGGSLLTRDELIELTAPDGDLTAQLEGVSGTSAVLAIDPSIPAAIRALGTSAPTRVAEWLDQLDALPNERFALQFGDADATTQAQANLPALLQPTTLVPLLDPANFQPQPGAATEAPAATPTPTPSAGPQLPDDQTLMAIDGATPGILWPRQGATADDLTRFAAYVGGSVTTVLPSTAFTEVSGGHVAVGEHDVLVTDAAASEALSDAAAEPESGARARSLAAAGAYLFFASQASGGAPLLVGLDRDDDRSATALRDAISAVDSPGVGLASLRSTPAAPATLSGDAGDARGASLQVLLAEESQLAAFSSILEEPQVLLSPERIRILRVIAVGSSTKRFDADVSEHRATTRETLRAVEIPQSSTIQLLTANADLPFQVRNDLPWPVTVRLSVAPTDPRLEVQSVTPAVIPANTNTRVKVPVSARVGSGELDLRLALFSPTGVELGDRQTVRVAVRAEWEGIGLTVFGALIVILVGLGVVRTVRRKRREADEAADEESGTAGHDRGVE
ncbi:DUF6049 family protein [Microbacterium sp. XT11]|uniref:DUF6049 family protein n=1 Tax=Microbacterium sp. XT11 TaxID=367477 RepID=UPI000742F9B3|nr:DUF6049 family protein [Microbacterium sp. XT11]ALX65999.1 hypothetical protein AB663_000843 [Microbacterium sp. XT11]